MSLKFIKSGLLAVLLIFTLPVLAHDARPVVVTIEEQLSGIYQYSVKVPETVDLKNQPDIHWPDGCKAQVTSHTPGLLTGSASCSQHLQGLTLSLDFPYYNPSLASYYRLTTLDGEMRMAMRSPTEASWEIPQAPTTGNVAFEYLSLGVEHIVGGLDHLLFVLGLMVIARTARRILWTVTGFTIAHSITLSLSSLGVVYIPIVPVEAAIALSIVFLAYEISHEHNNSLTYRYPLIVSFGFGLLHGLGFASALGEIGLVPNEIMVSLLFFNLGVEAGQIAFILLVAAAVMAIQRLVRVNARLNEVLTLHRVEMLAAYVIGIPASYWLVERVSGLLI